MKHLIRSLPGPDREEFVTVYGRNELYPIFANAAGLQQERGKAMNSIEDWQQGWNETEALLAYLSAQVQSYKQAHPPTSAIGSILFDSWGADLAAAKDDAVKHKSATRIEPSLRALSFEEDKLEDWASWLDQRMTSMTGLRRYIAEKWRDSFREEAELDRQLIASSVGMTVEEMDAE